MRTPGSTSQHSPSAFMAHPSNTNDPYRQAGLTHKKKRGRKYPVHSIYGTLCQPAPTAQCCSHLRLGCSVCTPDDSLCSRGSVQCDQQQEHAATYSVYRPVLLPSWMCISSKWDWVECNQFSKPGFPLESLFTHVTVGFARILFISISWVGFRSSSSTLRIIVWHHLHTELQMLFSQCRSPTLPLFLSLHYPFLHLLPILLQGFRPFLLFSLGYKDGPFTTAFGFLRLLQRFHQPQASSMNTLGCHVGGAMSAAIGANGNRPPIPHNRCI